VDGAWAVFVVCMMSLMWVHPTLQTFPYHLIWVITSLLYGFRLWRPVVITTVLTVLTVATAFLLLRSYQGGTLASDELAEVPLMPLIVGLGAWHAWRRAVAQRRVSELAAQEKTVAFRQREFLRDASHAIRTPVTIARGHVELIQMATADEVICRDSEEVLHQLDRLHHLAGRLLSIERLETTPALNLKPIDAQALIARIARRWSAAVSKQWIVAEGPAAYIHADENQLTDALDAIVENALKFTETDDIVRFAARTVGPWVVFDVAASGPGIPEANRVRVFDRFYHRPPQGAEPGTGLGLALVAAVAGAHGGHARASSAAEGGALVSLRLPAASVMPPPGEDPGEHSSKHSSDVAPGETPALGSGAG